MYDDPREDASAAQTRSRRILVALTAVLLLGGSALAASPLARSSSKLVAPRAELRRQIAATSAVETPVALRSSRTIGPHRGEATPTTRPAPQLIDAAVHDIAEASLVGVAEVPAVAVDVDPSAPGAADAGGDAPAPPPPGTQPAGTVAAPPATVAAAPATVASTPTTPPITTPATPPITTLPTPATSPPTTPLPSPTTTPTPVAETPVPADDTSSTVPDDGDDRDAGKHRGDTADEEHDDDKEHGNKHQRGDGGDDDAETDAETDD